MASNAIPNGLPQLFALAEDMADGCHTHETAVGIKQNKEADVRADLNAARTGETDYAAAKGVKDELSIDLRIADSNARAFLKAGRAVLAQSLGEIWSATWEPTGFPNQSTAVPSTQEERMSLCASLKAYFTANAAKENAPLGVTAANADTKFSALSDARTAVNNGNTISGQKRDVRDGFVAQLKNRLRGLVAELGQLMDDNDPRWDAFGLNAPGASEIPDVPEALVVTSGAPGTLFIDWADARRAARYRVWIQVLTVDADFRAATTVADSDATVSGLPGGKTVKVRVTAANDAGESQASATVEAVVA